MVGTESNLFRSFRGKALQRPHSAPEKLVPSRDSPKLQGHRRPQTASRQMASMLSSPGNRLLDIRGLRKGAEAQIQQRPEMSGAQCEVKLADSTGKLMRVKAESLSPPKSPFKLGSSQEQRIRTAARATSAGNLWLSQHPARQLIDGPFFRRQPLKPGADVALDSEQAAKGFAAFLQDQLSHGKDGSSMETSPKRSPVRSQSDAALPAILAATGQSKSRNAFARKSNGNFFKEAQWHET
mmetsp:Transcript_69266/g.130606  ORF Transcript_69266/g.130606 Transcript_69266/m.130606 type:complete len:239 (+) Transcript_69266:131-847(+)